MVLYLGGLIMAYFLRQEKKKKGTYLQMYDSYWDKEKKDGFLTLVNRIIWQKPHNCGFFYVKFIKF